MGHHMIFEINKPKEKDDGQSTTTLKMFGNFTEHEEKIIRSCIGKQRHNTRQLALKEVKNKTFLQPYKCRYCKFWHVGSFKSEEGIPKKHHSSDLKSYHEKQVKYLMKKISYKPYEAGVLDENYLESRWIPFEKKDGKIIVKKYLNLQHEPTMQLPDDLTVLADLNMLHYQNKKLPKGLHVCGNLNLFGAKLEELPNDLIVDGDLNISYSTIKKLSSGLVVLGELDLSFTSIGQLPNGVRVCGGFKNKASKDWKPTIVYGNVG